MADFLRMGVAQANSDDEGQYLRKWDMHTLPLARFEAFKVTLHEESDRGRVLLAIAWIDEFLKISLMNEFAQGNSRARAQLFSANGPFATFSAKLNVAFCAGWIDSDVYNDVEILRKIRNECAHDVEPVSLSAENNRHLLGQFRVPHRAFDDWGQLRAASTENGVVIYVGERPDEAKEDLYIPGNLTFGMALSVIVAVLVSDLKIPFTTGDSNEVVILSIPDYLKEPSRSAPNPGNADV